MAAHRIITGIDIGTYKTATVITTVNEEDALSIIGVSESESKGIRKGQIVDIEEATEAIVKSLEAAERMAGYQVNSAYVSVGGTHISSQNSHGVVAVADPSKEITENDVVRVVEAAKAISLAPAKKIIHVLPRFFTVDSQEGIKDPIGMSGVRLEVDTHLVIGGLTSLRNVEKCISNVGIEVEGLVFNGLASAESVLSETEKELGVVLLDVGAGTTDVGIYVEGALSYSSVLPVGARNVTNDIAIGLRVSLESAENMKRFLSKKRKTITKPKLIQIERKRKENKSSKQKESSFERNKYEEDMLDVTSLDLQEGIKTIQRRTLVDGIIKPRLHELFTLVSSEIKKSGLAGVVPSGIVLTGGGAKTIGIHDAAKRTIALPFRVGIPKEIKGVTDEALSPSFATAIGLTRYGMRQEPSRTTFPFIKLPHFIKGAPLKGSAGKVVDLFKTLLP